MAPARWQLVSVILSFAVLAASSKPKHIVFLMIDDLGFNDVSYQNTSDLSSPNIDALATNGLRLGRYYTHNLCSPSRTSFLSGRFAYSIGMQGCVIINGQAVDLPRNVSTVADRLHQGGFRNAAIGKWDAGMTTWDYTPTCRGFDYFYGYYGPAQDYFTHQGFGALDLRENFEPVRNESGTYSTHLYTRKAQEWIRNEVLTLGSRKTFLYLAYQAMHGPIEAPESYVKRCGHVTTANKRNIYCGMMLALDEGIGNLTRTYQELGIWNDTVLVLAADNGGHIGASGNNWPLRGEKSTNYEGGVRGVSFLHWPPLTPELRGTESNHFVHVADWLPTFVGGVAGLQLSSDKYKYPLDGVDQWASLTTLGADPARPASAGLLHEIGGDNNIPQEAYLEPPYKLIRQHPTIYNWNKYLCSDKECPTGWMPVPGQGAPIPPPAAENHSAGALVNGGTWLFDVLSDPLEHEDLSEKLPDVVAKLGAALDKWKQRGIDQRLCPVDPLSNPKKYFEGVWTPWRGSREPTCNAGGSNEQCTSIPDQPDSHLDGIALGKTCTANGWCSGPKYSGPALQVHVLVDGVVRAQGKAALHRKVAGNHGFQLAVDCSLLAEGVHRVQVKCLNANTGKQFELKGSPICLKDKTKEPCSKSTSERVAFV